MKQVQRILSVLLLCSCSIGAAALGGRTFFTYRSQSTDAARQLAGWRAYYNDQYAPVQPNYGTFTLTAAYNTLTDAQKIANYFFDTSMLAISGSRARARSGDAVLADYFGLPTDYDGMICFFPAYKSSLLDFDWYLGLDNWHKGMYLTIHVPVVYVQTTMGAVETTRNPGELNYPAGYMANRLIEPREMASCALETWQSKVIVGDIQPLKYGKLGCPQSEAGFGDLQAAFGFNVLNRERYYFGLNLRATIPLGTRPEGRFIFEPVVGNGKHWEFGFGMAGDVLMWENPETNRSWSFYGTANFMHLFATRQRRSYDLYTNGGLSRYMLLEVMGHPVVQGLELKELTIPSSTDVVPPVVQYAGALLPAINATTLMSDISIGIQVDFACMVAYRHNGLNINVGYNLWGRMGENLVCRERLPNDVYGVKGDAQVYGFDHTSHRFVALNATQSQATILSGQTTSTQKPPNAAEFFTNETADDAGKEMGKAWFLGSVLDQSTPTGIVGTGLVSADIAQVHGSQQAILLTDDDIDNVSGLAPSALSQKLFVHIDYAWCEHEGVVPFFGIGAEFELDGGSGNKIDALSQTGFWLKGGIAF